MEKDLRRAYLFSDTFGGHDDYTKRPDADAHICTDFRSFPNAPVRREFDTYGERPITDHILRLILSEHDRIMSSKNLPDQLRNEFAKTITGIFINTAERTEAHKNGHPFYVATARDGSVRIVTTPLSALAPIRKEIETLEKFSNTGNGLYKDDEQFRSSYTPTLLYPNHGYNTSLINTEAISLPRPLLHVAYVDRFGNMITHAEEPEMSRILEMLGTSSEVSIHIGEVRDRVRVTTSLGDAEPGDLSVYVNGGIDIVRKWEKGETDDHRLRTSAYGSFDKPKIGTAVSLEKIG